MDCTLDKYHINVKYPEYSNFIGLYIGDGLCF